MNIGDKVRVIHGNEEGFVTKIIDKQLVEIEIEPGFTMPVLRNELVLINKAEREHFDSDEIRETVNQKVERNSSLSNTGIFIAFVKTDSVLADMYLINNTDYDLVCTLSTGNANEHKGIFKGMVNSSRFELITKWNIKDFDSWPELHFQSLYFNKDKHTPLAPIVKKIKFKAKSFFNSQSKAPIINKEAYTYGVDAIAFDTNNLLSSSSKSDTPSIDVPDDIVDLHIEQLIDESDDLSPKEKMDYQFNHFQKQLEAAIAVHKREITFIHGTGNGTLKSAIHKELSSRKDIAYFQDALKSKFGYGATLVCIAE